MSEANRFHGLDGLRALAASSVVLTHVGVYSALESTGLVSPQVVNAFDGGAAVQAFFVLSGFLITGLLLAEQTRNGAISLYNFYVRRSLRIFPLYFLIVALTALAWAIGEHVTTLRSLAYAALYIYNFIPKEHYTAILGHLWSLAVEEHFYLVWPVVMLAVGGRLRRLQLVTLAFIAVSMASALVLGSIDWLDDAYFVKRWTFIAGANIAFGAMLAMLLQDPQFSQRVRAFLASPAAPILAGLLIFTEAMGPDLPYFVSQYARGIGYTLLIGWIVTNPASLATRALEWSPLVYLGKVSYGIYMFQGFFLSTGPYRAPGQTWPPEQAVGLVLLVIAVPLSFHFFEQPLIRMKRRFERPPLPTQNS